jgi:5'(3')-deoxyribonucleotidase
VSLLHIDLDDTTVDLLEGVRTLHNLGKPTEEHVLLHQLNDWGKNGTFIEQYLGTEGLYYNLKIAEHAVEVLKKLGTRHEVKFLTAYPTSQSAKEKIDFVEQYFPFIGVKNTTLTWSKGDIKGDLLFDDSPSFLPQFGGLKVIFDKPYNKHTKADARVSSWLEFYSVIEQFEASGLLTSKLAL